jgi:succinate dehydrogenase/fumarate reductase cytochrome b subunit
LNSLLHAKNVGQRYLNRILVGVSFLMIIGFMFVNFFFIFNIVFRTGEDKVKFFSTVKYLFMSSWIVIVSWFVLGVFVYYCKQSGRPYKSDEHK